MNYQAAQVSFLACCRSSSCYHGWKINHPLFLNFDSRCCLPIHSHATLSSAVFSCFRILGNFYLDHFGCFHIEFRALKVSEFFKRALKVLRFFQNLSLICSNFNFLVIVTYCSYFSHYRFRFELYYHSSVHKHKL